MLSTKDITNVVIFLAILYLINKILNKVHNKAEEEGGLAAITTTQNLLSSDVNGNLGLYNPAVDGFTTNEVKVMNGTTTNFTSNSSGTSINGMLNADGGLKSTTAEFTGLVNATGGLKTTTAQFTGKINGLDGEFSSNVHFAGGASIPDGKRLYIAGNGDTGYFLSRCTKTNNELGVELRGLRGGKLGSGIDGGNVAALEWDHSGDVSIKNNLNIGGTITLGGKTFSQTNIDNLYKLLNGDNNNFFTIRSIANKDMCMYDTPGRPEVTGIACNSGESERKRMRLDFNVV